MSLRFERITGTAKQIDDLYGLLKGRVHNISHKKHPRFAQHENFVKNNPYLHWFLVRDRYQICGTMYIKDDNSIGLNINDPTLEILEACLKFICDNFKPQPSKSSVVPDYFYVNIAYRNKHLLEALCRLGLEPIQISLRV